jgi:uncharacterized protein
MLAFASSSTNPIFPYNDLVLFLIFPIAIVLANIAWWRWADRRARLFRHPRAWRIAIAAFAILPLLFALIFLLVPPLGRQSHLLPIPFMTTIYIWNILVLPAALLWIAGIHLAESRAKKRANLSPSPGTPSFAEIARWKGRGEGLSNASEQPTLTRRQALAAAAIAVPPLVTMGLASRAMAQMGSFRLRSIDVPISNLPPSLDGLTIAHVSDIHIGKFTRSGVLQQVIETTNQLRADLVIYAGDLIDLSLSDLPAGIDLINKLDSRFGLVMIEGNHDLVQDPDEFERATAAANLPVLFDQAKTLNVRGVPIQFLGIRWGKPDDGPRRYSNNEVIRDSVKQVLTLRDPGAFPILLGHHPHAFDSAIEAQIPLTLSGHTHGGQLMLTEQLGAGPVMFKYWSGLYQRGNSSLVVSNGVGNWFPLRVNAPAEIIHITLRAQPATIPTISPAASRQSSQGLPRWT